MHDAKPYDQLTDDQKKLRDLYDAFLDGNGIEANGLTPVRSRSGHHRDLKTLDDVARVWATRVSAGRRWVGIGIDEKHPDNYSIDLGQAGLGMPDRDYYL